MSTEAAPAAEPEQPHPAAPIPAPYWTVSILIDGIWYELDQASKPILNPTELLPVEPEHHHYRYRAAHAAMGQIMHGAEAVKINRHPELPTNTQ